MKSKNEYMKCESCNMIRRVNREEMCSRCGGRMKRMSSDDITTFIDELIDLSQQKNKHIEKLESTIDDMCKKNQMLQFQLNDSTKQATSYFISLENSKLKLDVLRRDINILKDKLDTLDAKIKDLVETNEEQSYVIRNKIDSFGEEVFAKATEDYICDLKRELDERRCDSKILKEVVKFVKDWYYADIADNPIHAHMRKIYYLVTNRQICSE